MAQPLPELWIVSPSHKLTEHIFFHIQQVPSLLACLNNPKIHWVFARLNLPNNLPIAPENIHIMDIFDERSLSLTTQMRQFWMYHDDDEIRPNKQLNSNKWWLYLEPYFLLHCFNLEFWSSWGQWLQTSYQDLVSQSRNHLPISQLFALVHPLLHPSNLPNLAKLNTDFRQLEFAASCTIWNERWMKYAGRWEDKLWGNWTEWIIRGSILSTNQFHKSSRQRAIQQASGLSWPLNSRYISPDLSPNVPHPTIGKTTAFFPRTDFPKKSTVEEYCPPAILDKNWADWSWGALCLFYGLRYPVTEIPEKWTDIMPIWDQIQTQSPPSFPVSFPINESFRPELTIAVTACVRPAIFQRTLQTFVRHAVDLKKFSVQWIIHIDPIPQNISMNTMVQTFFQTVHPSFYNNNEMNVHWIVGQKPGFAKAFQRILQEVKTQFFFYLQDDWEFLLPFFMEDLLVPMIPYSNTLIGVHLYKLDGGTNARPNLLYLSPCMMKTSAWKLLIPWIIPGYDPEQLLRPAGNTNPRGSFWISNTQFVGKCHAPRGEQVFVRDLGRPWMQQVGIVRNNQVNPIETFDHWIIRG